MLVLFWIQIIAVANHYEICVNQRHIVNIMSIMEHQKERKRNTG